MKYTIDNNTIQFEQGNNQISVSVKELEHILQKANIMFLVPTEPLIRFHLDFGVNMVISGIVLTNTTILPEKKVSS